jgi:flagellar biosynthesis protein FlhF
VGADAQLRTYADLLGVPFALATAAEDLLRHVDRFGRRRIWIDTAGRGPGDQAGLAELLRCRDALGERAQVDLVLSATTRPDDLRAEIARHRALRPDGLIVTKLDETTAPADVVELALDDTLPPLRWLGTGQRVPEDLRVPDPASLAEHLFGAAA